MQKIRFIVETVTSAPDASNNSYHFARITSTLTGKYLRLETWGTDNARGIVEKVCPLDRMYCIGMTIPKGQWRERKRGIEHMEHTITADDLLALEK